jgi:hypothetical protein
MRRGRGGGERNEYQKARAESSHSEISLMRL